MSGAEQFPVDLAVAVLKNIKNYLNISHVFLYCFHRKLCCRPVGEAENSGRNTAEHYAFYAFSSASSRQEV